MRRSSISRGTFQSTGHRKAMAITVGCLTLAKGLAGAGISSLESNVDASDVNAAFEMGSLSADEMRRQLGLARESIKTLTASLVAANEQAELFEQKYSKLARRTEALGLEAIDQDPTGLEQRLLNAVSDLRLLQTQRDKYRDQVSSLSEAVLQFLKSSTGGDALARMELEAQLRASNEQSFTLQGSKEETPTLMDARVVSLKEEWSLVVGNLGKQQGVKIGMPMRVMRDGKLIATLRVVDVRQRICGAVIQEMGSGKIHIGDHLEADARTNGNIN